MVITAVSPRQNSLGPWAGRSTLNTPCRETAIGAPVGWPRKSHGCAVATSIPRGQTDRQSAAVARLLPQPQERSLAIGIGAEGRNQRPAAGKAPPSFGVPASRWPARWPAAAACRAAVRDGRQAGDRASHELPISDAAVDSPRSTSHRRTRDDHEPSIHCAKFVE